MRKTWNFTLVEMLVVIAIIAILAGLTMPAVNTARQKARTVQVMADINALRTALIGMDSTYGASYKVASGKYAWDNAGGASVTSGDSPAADTIKIGGNTDAATYDALLYELTMTERRDGNAIEPKVNTRKLTFMEPRSNNAVFTDPWGTRYIIVMNVNNAKYIKHTVDSDNLANPAESSFKLFTKYLIYSCGPNKKDNEGMNRSNGGTVTDKGKGIADDINSWDKY
ncbi:MAG: type II secretion system protein [Victivallaceae bacterium]|nr:type II secretion system protein [Victivallaceae bacterium]